MTNKKLGIIFIIIKTLALFLQYTYDKLVVIASLNKIIFESLIKLFVIVLTAIKQHLT